MKENLEKNFVSQFWAKIFLLPNIFGPKFLLGLGYDSQNIYAQNTFLIDSQQINKKFDFVWESLIFSLYGITDKTNNSETELDLDLNHIQDISLTNKF